MFITKQIGWFPPSFSVRESGSSDTAQFSGPNAQANANEYAAFKNAPAAAQQEGK
jgi:hypothetical protein